MKKLLFLGWFLLAGITCIHAQTEPNREIKDLVIVFKTHFDNGYTELSETVLNQYAAKLIGGALKGIKESGSTPENRKFSWTLSGYPMKEILQRNPGAKPAVDEAIRNGSFAIHALPFTFETEAMTPELLVRGFAFSDEIARTHGLDLPIDAKLTDVPSHSWILPTVLAQAGVKFLHIGCNAASRSPEVPVIFWWEGPDGSRVMTIYWAGYYGTDLVPPAGWPHKTWLAIIHTNDNTGAPSAAEINATLEKARELAPNARIRVGRLSDFYESIIKENPDLPVVKGDMPDTWIHGYLSMPKEFKDYKQTLRDLNQVEAVGTTLTMIENTSPQASTIVPKAYEQLLLFAEHTFGMAMSHGHSGIWRYDEDFAASRARGEYAMIEHSWKEKGNHVFEAQRITIPALTEEMSRLAAGISVKGGRIVVYNPLPYTRSGPVEIKAHSGWYGMKAIKDAETGEAIPLINQDNIYRFIARDVPAMGYRTYVPAEAAQVKPASGITLDEATGTLSNQYLTVRIDKTTGSVVSVIDKSTGMEMVNQASAEPFGGYLYQYFSKEQVDRYAKAYIKGGWDWAPAELGRPNLDNRPGYTATGSAPEVHFETDPARVTARVTFKPGKQVPHHYVLIYNLYPGQQALEVIWHIQSKPAEPWPEGGWISFPFNLKDPEFRLGRLGGIADPRKDFVKGTNFDYFMTDKGVALIGPGGAGFAVTSPDAPAVSLDRPGLWTWSGNFIPAKPNVYFNLFNNQWSTNFTEWIEGSWSARFYVWGFSKFDPAASLTAMSENVSTPLQAAIAGGSGGNLPRVWQGIAISKKNISVSNLSPDPETGGYLLRLWETAGLTTEAEIILPQNSGIVKAQPVDLRGRINSPVLSVSQNSIKVSVQANQPLTLKLLKK